MQECLKVDHSSAVAMLEKQYSLLKLKKVLHGYGIRDFNFTDTSKGWVSLYSIDFYATHRASFYDNIVITLLALHSSHFDQ